MIEREGLTGLMMLLRPGFATPTPTPGQEWKSTSLNNLDDKSPLEFPVKLYDLTPSGTLPTKDNLTKDDAQSLLFFLHYIRCLLPMMYDTATGTKIVLEKQRVKGREGYYFALLIGPFDPFVLDVPNGCRLLHEPLTYLPFTDFLGKYISQYVSLYSFIHPHKVNCLLRPPIVDPPPALNVTFDQKQLFGFLYKNCTDMERPVGAKMIYQIMDKVNATRPHECLRKLQAALNLREEFSDENCPTARGYTRDPIPVDTEQLLEQRDKIHHRIEEELRASVKHDVHRELVRQRMQSSAEKAQPKISGFFVKKKQQKNKHPTPTPSGRTNPGSKMK